MNTSRTREPRIFAQKMARELSHQEIDAIAGAHGGGGGCLTFCLGGTEVDDATGNCQIP